MTIKTLTTHTATVPTRRRLTVEEYHRMVERGILAPDERLELIDGVLIQMAAIGNRHFACVNRLNELLVLGVTGRAVVSTQNAVRLSTRSEPQPDLTLVRRSVGFSAVPEPGDVFLIVEVADSSLRYDRMIKLPLYARSGITEVWLVDLEHQHVTVHRQPEGNAYQQITVYERGASLSPLAFPDLRLTVDAILD